MSRPAQDPPIRLASPFQDPVGRWVFGLVGGALEKLLALDRVNQTYVSAAGDASLQPFPEKVLRVMNITLEVSDRDLGRIPETGPVVVVANHPFGGIEGIALGALLRRVRPDVKLMANFLLDRFPELREGMIFVDPFARPESARQNIRPIKESIRWLRDGHLLGVFPAGEVAHLDLQRRELADPPWSETVARLVRHAEAPVVPVFFAGTNGLVFQLAGLLHPRLRTALLPTEFMNKRDRTLAVRIGHPIAFRKLGRMSSDRDLIDYARMRTYHLRYRDAGQPRRRRRLPVRLRFHARPEAAVAEGPPREWIAQEIGRLPREQLLLESRPFAVLCAEASQIPHARREIGRLRELTFRAAGEGTGRPLDLDRFDDYYLHLFVWNRETQEIVGAYRLGPTDLILARFGLRGLYTSTLFRYRARLLREIGPALEMGRSFVRPEYQRSHAALLLLWKGIARYVARHPRYKVLFGPVSINAAYQSVSKTLLLSFLRLNRFSPDLARLVRARTPVRQTPAERLRGRRFRRLVRDLDEADELIADLEAELGGVPILLKQYLKLGGRLLGFNVDPAFGHVVDGLILVDLTRTEPRMLAKYMEPENMQAFLRHHGVRP